MEEARTIISGDKVYRPVLDDTLVEDDLRVAREELNENPEKTEIALKELRKRLTEQDEFTSCTDDNYLLIFLRYRKFDIDRTFKSVRDNYKFQKQHPDIFPLPSIIEKVLKTGCFSVLPHRDHMGRMVSIIKFSLWNPNEISYSDFMAAATLCSEYAIENAVTQINGSSTIWDFQGYTLKHFLNICSPRNIILLITLALDRFPGKFKVAYCVNSVSLMKTTWNLFKPLVKEKIRDRIKILGSDMKDLHAFLDPCILPEEYGGTFKIPEIRDFAKLILDNEERIKYNRKFGF